MRGQERVQVGGNASRLDEALFRRELRGLGFGEGEIEDELVRVRTHGTTSEVVSARVRVLARIRERGAAAVDAGSTAHCASCGHEGPAEEFCSRPGDERVSLDFCPSCEADDAIIRPGQAPRRSLRVRADANVVDDHCSICGEFEADCECREADPQACDGCGVRMGDYADDPLLGLTMRRVAFRREAGGAWYLARWCMGYEGSCLDLAQAALGGAESYGAAGLEPVTELVVWTDATYRCTGCKRVAYASESIIASLRSESSEDFEGQDDAAVAEAIDFCLACLVDDAPPGEHVDLVLACPKCGGAGPFRVLESGTVMRGMLEPTEEPGEYRCLAAYKVADEDAFTNERLECHHEGEGGWCGHEFPRPRWLNIDWC